MLSCGGTPRRLTVASAGTRKGRRSIPLPRPFSKSQPAGSIPRTYPRTYSVT